MIRAAIPDTNKPHNTLYVTKRFHGEAGLREYMSVLTITHQEHPSALRGLPTLEIREHHTNEEAITEQLITIDNVTAARLVWLQLLVPLLPLNSHGSKPRPRIPAHISRNLAIAEPSEQHEIAREDQLLLIKDISATRAQWLSALAEMLDPGGQLGIKRHGAISNTPILSQGEEASLRRIVGEKLTHPEHLCLEIAYNGKFIDISALVHPDDFDEEDVDGMAADTEERLRNELSESFIFQVTYSSH